MISFILGVLTTLIAMLYYFRPQPVVLYREDAIEKLGYEDMSSQFSTVLDLSLIHI